MSRAPCRPVFPAPNEDPNPKCAKCEGTNKNAPVVGLVILSGLSKAGDEYVGGQILDPDRLGRSQTWEREE